MHDSLRHAEDNPIDAGGTLRPDGYVETLKVLFRKIHRLQCQFNEENATL